MRDRTGPTRAPGTVRVPGTLRARGTVRAPGARRGVAPPHRPRTRDGLLVPDGARPRLLPRLPESRRARRRLLRCAVALCVLALLPSAWLRLTQDSRVRSEQDVPSAPVAVVFGAGLTGNVPSAYLAHRLDAAVRLYDAGKVRVILATGDNSRPSYNEPAAMRTYLEAHGVPASRVVLDYAGFDTWDSCDRARRIFGVRRAVLVTQGFHVDRALALCKAAGIDAYGVGVDERHDATWYAGGTREVLAADKAALDVVLKPNPKFLGRHETAVARALAAR